jgi:hypothetical protein
MDWQPISETPVKGSRILVFTPVWGHTRYRVIDAELLPTLTEATHWTNLEPPPEYWDKPL